MNKMTKNQKKKADLNLKFTSWALEVDFKDGKRSKKSCDFLKSEKHGEFPGGNGIFGVKNVSGE